MSWTDYAGTASVETGVAAPGLLDLEGLRLVARLVRELRQSGEPSTAAGGML